MNLAKVFILPKIQYLGNQISNIQYFVQNKNQSSLIKQQMHINGPDFVRRRILRDSNDYSPKRRWDENAFGSERRILLNHVEKTLKDHQNDGDILKKFRKQAEQLKEKRRMEKFPHLYKSGKDEKNLSIINQKMSEPYLNEFQQPSPSSNQIQERQEFPQCQSRLRPTFQPPQINYPTFTIPATNPYQLQARLQYERTIAQKDLELYKKEQKIKRQKKEINRLYRQIKQREKEDELEKYVQKHEEIKKMNQMLVEMREEISGRRSLLSDKEMKNESILLSAKQLPDQRRNKSELYLNSFNSLGLLKEHLKEKTQPKFPVTPVKNPEIAYSPQIKKNRSSVFENVPKFNPPFFKNNSISEHLSELKNYNQRLEYLNTQNQSKLAQIG